MKAPLAVVCCFAAARALAAPPDIKSRIAQVAERHVATVACPGVKISAADVLALVPEPGFDAMPKYAVLWNGDLGCYGGSGTERTNLTIGTVNTGRVVVQPGLSSPVVAFESPARFVSRVVGSGPDTLVLEGNEYGPNDPNSSPSVPVRFTLRLDAKGNWVLADKAGLTAR